MIRRVLIAHEISSRYDSMTIKIHVKLLKKQNNIVE